MAGDWIKMRIGIETDPAVFAIASRLKLDRFAVVGRLSAFWGWMNQHSEDGVVVVSVDAPVDGAVDAPTSPLVDTTLQSREMIDAVAGAKGFADALKSVGWLILTRTGFEIPSFDRYNRASAKSRSAKSARQARWREKQREAKAKNDEHVDAPVDGTVDARVDTYVDGGVDVSRRDGDASREEKRREEKSNKKTPLPPSGDDVSKPPTAKENTEAASGVPIPPTLDTPEFRESWATWLKDRYDRRKAVTATAAKAQLDKLAKVGVAKAIETINNSIANGWAGLFPEPDKPATKPPTPPRRAYDVIT